MRLLGESFALVGSSLETTRSASTKRDPCEKQCTGEETIVPQRGLEERDEKSSKARYLVCGRVEGTESKDEITAMLGTLPGLCD